MATDMNDIFGVLVFVVQEDILMTQKMLQQLLQIFSTQERILAHHTYQNVFMRQANNYEKKL